MKRLSNLDMAKNEIQNAVVQVLASDPSSPVAGQIYYNSTDSRLKQYTGSAWIEYSTSTSAGDASTNTATSVDSEVALFSGTTGKLIKRATISGLAKLTSGVLSAAASGTDYAPATATTSSLKGNGSGGFSAATLNDNGAPTADYSMNSHKLTNVLDPTSAQDAATKAYVDSTAAGIDWKASVRAATTATGTLASAYANGSVIDGVTLATGDRILIKDQTSGSENGIYVVAASGAPSRATDADTNAEVTGGLAVFVEEGTANADTGWVITNNGAITLGTTALVFTQFTGLGQVTAGTGLAKSGNTISIENSGVLLVTHGGTGSSTAAGARTNLGATTKFTATIGDGSTTAIAVTHSLGTQDVIAQIRDASTNAVVECDITQTSTTVTTFTFTTAPATNAYKVVIIG